MKVVIEKELCHPVNGEIVGPYYHVVRYTDDGEREVLKTFDGDIKEAARYAEHEIDVEVLAVAYKENPDSFSSVSAFSIPNDYKPSYEAVVYEGKVVSIDADYITVRYVDGTGNAQLFYASPNDKYELGDKVELVAIFNPENPLFVNENVQGEA